MINIVWESRSNRAWWVSRISMDRIATPNREKNTVFPQK